MKLSHKERHALAEMAKLIGQRDYSTIHGRTIHALERKGLLGLEGSDSRCVTAAGRAELAVPDVFDDLFKEKESAMTKTPWDDCKVAIGIDNDEPLNDSEIFENLGAGRGLPRGWVLDELDGTGSRWVAVFRVAGFPTAYAGKRVQSVLRAIGALT